MIEQGTHTYGKADPGQALRAAVARDNQLTVAELKVAASVRFGSVEVAPDGALIPAQAVGRVDGWAGDRTHREGQTARLRGLYDRMQEHSDAVTEAIRTGQHPDSLISRAVAMRNLWGKIVEELED